ncbi:E3 ubiquitin-protein ligase TRIM7-like isoform X5 [Larus michahellis]|uniref:E3 ubiquitin-protein ligase TRIM7-like isoform X5 n=1 Tax=Larus michahellis TaxID=119627 RepID=UPI003D9B33AE
MASGSSRAGEGGEDSTHRTVPQHPAHLGSDPTVCGGGTTRSWPERGRLGDAEAVGHRSRLRKGNFQPKLRLERLEEKLKLLGLEGGREEKTHLCSWRRGTVASEAAAKASGSSRDGPRAGGGPTAAHAEEPAREDEEQTRRDLEKLKKRREELLGVKTSGERRFREFLTRTEAERQKVVSEFRQLRRFLKDQELVLLAGLGELGREATRKREEEETRISGEISLLDVLVCETEKKLEQPPGGFLQDVVPYLRFASRWETGRAGRTETETETFLDLERRLRAVSRQNDVLREALGRFQDALLAELEKEGGAPPGEDGKAFVTLDPDTANARLVVSRDRRGVGWRDGGQDPPPTPRRFDASRCLLGRRGFATGRRWWEVEVAGDGAWALGVARGSVPRKGWLEFQPEKGIWALGRCGNRYRAFASPVAATTFAADDPPGASGGRVRVALDYDGGRVAFSLGGGQPPLFTFRNAAFGGERVFPFFWVGRGSRLRLCP